MVRNLSYPDRPLSAQRTRKASKISSSHNSSPRIREENTLNARNLIPGGVEEPSAKVAGASDVKLRHVDYNSPEVTAAGIDNIITKRDRAYGMVMDVGAQVGLRKSLSKCRSQF